jgi:serine/threonine-protein kinase HipA
MVCRSTLQTIKNGYFSKKAAIELFGVIQPIVHLSFSRSEFFTEGSKHVQGMSISGVQQKLSLKISNNDFEIVSTGGEFILKPSPESFPYASENEHCAMALSAEVGINTALCALLCFADGENVYITKRYDRSKEGKLHQEDLAQAFDIPSSEKYTKSYEEA